MEVPADGGLQLVGLVGVIPEILLGGVPALAQADIAHVEPGAAFLDQVQLHAQIQHLAQAADALAVHDVKLRLPEGGRHLVFHHLGPSAVADDLAAGLQSLDAAHVDADGGIELQSPAAGGDLGISVHDAHLFPQLVDEDDDAVGFGDDAGELAQGLAHKPGVQAHEAVAHLALDLRPGHQGGHGVHHHHVDGAGADQGLGDFQGLLAGVRLGDQHILDPHAQGPGIGGIQGVLGVHKGHLAAQLLGLGQNVQGQGGLTGGLRPVDLDDAPPGHAADAQGQVQGQGAGGDGLHVGLGVFAVSHDGALAVHLLDLLHGRLQGLFFVGTRRDCGGRILFRCHFRLLL